MERLSAFFVGILFLLASCEPIALQEQLDSAVLAYNANLKDTTGGGNETKRMSSEFLIYAGPTPPTIASMSLGSDGTYISDTVNDLVWKVKSTGTLTALVSAPTFLDPVAVLSNKSDEVWVADSGQNKIYYWNQFGTAPTPITLVDSSIAGHADGDMATARLNLPSVLAERATARHLWVFDSADNQLRVINQHPSILPALDPLYVTTVVPSGVTLSGVKAMVFTDNDTLYIADTGNNRLVKLNVVTNQATVIEQPTVPLNSPQGLAVDPTNNGTLVVADTGNNRLMSWDLKGEAGWKILAGSVAGDKIGDLSTTLFRSPTALSATEIGATSPRIVIVDSGNQKLKVIQ